MFNTALTSVRKQTANYDPMSMRPDLQAQAAFAPAGARYFNVLEQGVLANFESAFRGEAAKTGSRTRKLFAAKNIARGQFLGVVPGFIIHVNNMWRPPCSQDRFIGEKYVVVSRPSPTAPLFPVFAKWFTNLHDLTPATGLDQDGLPNVRFAVATDRHSGAFLAVVSLRDISEGESLRVHYGPVHESVLKREGNDLPGLTWQAFGTAGGDLYADATRIVTVNLSIEYQETNWNHIRVSKATVVDTAMGGSDKDTMFERVMHEERTKIARIESPATTRAEPKLPSGENAASIACAEKIVTTRLIAAYEMFSGDNYESDETKKSYPDESAMLPGDNFETPARRMMIEMYAAHEKIKPEDIAEMTKDDIEKAVREVIDQRVANLSQSNALVSCRYDAKEKAIKALAKIQPNRLIAHSPALPWPRVEYKKRFNDTPDPTRIDVGDVVFRHLPKRIVAQGRDTEHSHQRQWRAGDNPAAD